MTYLSLFNLPRIKYKAGGFNFLLLHTLFLIVYLGMFFGVKKYQHMKNVALKKDLNTLNFLDKDENFGEKKMKGLVRFLIILFGGFVFYVLSGSGSISLLFICLLSYFEFVKKTKDLNTHNSYE